MNEHEQASAQEASGRSVEVTRRRSPAAFILTFIIMAATWVVLSGQFDSFHLSLGLISCLLVSWFSSDLIFANPGDARITGTWFRFLIYIPWLLWEIIKANVWLMYLVVHPRMIDLIDPHIIKFQSRLTSDMANVTFANSITLTPGTITVYVDLESRYSVHAIDRKSSSGLPGEMEDKVAWTFGED